VLGGTPHRVHQQDRRQEDGDPDEVDRRSAPNGRQARGIARGSRRASAVSAPGGAGYLRARHEGREPALPLAWLASYTFSLRRSTRDAGAAMWFDGKRVDRRDPPG